VKRLVVAPDKMRGTASARQVVAAVADVARAMSWQVDEVPLADGGEGFLDVLGTRMRTSTVVGPLGDPVEAEWSFDGTTAVIEMARASGLALIGLAANNDPVRASTVGTGELISEAVRSGAKRVLVGLGGSASTDGGLGAVQALAPYARLSGVRITVACDVTTLFADAARVFAPQKGATPVQVELLSRRLDALVVTYRQDFGVDVSELVGGCAAGGLAGGLAAVGAELVPGFDLVADRTQVDELIDGADLVVTAEGFLDAESFNGKVVGGVCSLAAAAGVPVLIVAGGVDRNLDVTSLLPDGHNVKIVSLTQEFGREAAYSDPASAIAQVVTKALPRYGE